jgi:hypothetical protein
MTDLSQHSDHKAHGTLRQVGGPGVSMKSRIIEELAQAELMLPNRVARAGD